jgi:acyl-CoA dehydrogenase family protein 9
MKHSWTTAPGGFMEKVYRGGFGESAFHSYPAPRGPEKVRPLLEKYHQLLRAYPVERIEAEGRIPREMMKEMGEEGFFGISIPQFYGGLGVSLLEFLGMVEEIAALDLSIALVFLAHLFIGVKGIELFGTEVQKGKYLIPAASGEMIFSYALTEPKIGSDARHIETMATLSEDGTHYVVNGTKTYITNANYAGGLTVFSQMDPERPGFMGAFIIETAWEGVKIGMDMPKMGLKASSTATIEFHNVRVPQGNLIGRPGEGYKIALAVLNYGRLGLGAASAGVMEQSYKDMAKRAQSRVQFGKPIANFSLIQEKLVKARVYGFVMSSMNHFAAGLLESDEKHNPVIETSHCKLFGTTRAWATVYDALQIAGGSGYLSTQPYEKRMRDFRVTTIFEGTTEIHSIYPSLFALDRLGKEMRALSGLKRRIFLLKMLLASLTKPRWPIRSEDGKMREALDVAQSLARKIRRMLLLGLLFYGRSIGEKQFYLRRITTLSLYLFGILSALSRMSKENEKGMGNRHDSDLLAYFVEEAKEVRGQNQSIFDTEKEKLTARIQSQLSGTNHAGSQSS